MIENESTLIKMLLEAIKTLKRDHSKMSPTDRINFYTALKLCSEDGIELAKKDLGLKD